MASTDPFEALAECSEAVVFVTDLTMRMLYASTALERETGYTAANFQFPQDDNPFIHREDADEVQEQLATFIGADEATCTISNRFLDRWGRTHAYRSTVAKVVYRDTPALLFTCRANEPEPRRSSDDGQYRALVESSDDAIVRVDNAGRFLFSNRRALELFGYSAVELGRVRLDDIVAAPDRVRLTDELTRVVGSSRRARFQLTIVTRGGAASRFDTVITPLGSYGHPGELIAILRPHSAT